MLHIALVLILPLLQVAAPTPNRVVGIELGIRWEPGETIATGLENLVGTVVCPGSAAGGNPLVAVDSAGAMVELRFSDGKWLVERKFSAGEDVTVVCAGAVRGKEKNWDLFLGTRSGRVIQFSRGIPGWSSHEVATLPGPILNLQASQAAVGGASASLFAVDGEGRVTEFYLSSEGQWQSGALPPIPGGATEITFHYESKIFWVAAAGAEGVVHRFHTDSLNRWQVKPWATLTAPPLDMAASTDMTMRDIAIFYSGLDGAFRYLFHGRTEDEISRLPIANAASFLVGSGDRRRANEFFAVSGREFCLFEYVPGFEEWERIPIGPVGLPVVSSAFGPGRENIYHQIYVGSLDGTITEFLRTPVESDDELK